MIYSDLYLKLDSSFSTGLHNICNIYISNCVSTEELSSNLESKSEYLTWDMFQVMTIDTSLKKHNAIYSKWAFRFFRQARVRRDEKTADFACWTSRRRVPYWKRLLSAGLYLWQAGEDARVCMTCLRTHITHTYSVCNRTRDWKVITLNWTHVTRNKRVQRDDVFVTDGPGGAELLGLKWENDCVEIAWRQENAESWPDKNSRHRGVHLFKAPLLKVLLFSSKI